MLGFRILVRPVLAVSVRGSRPCQEAKKKIPPELLQQLDEAMHYQCKGGWGRNWKVLIVTLTRFPDRFQTRAKATKAAFFGESSCWETFLFLSLNPKPYIVETHSSFHCLFQCFYITPIEPVSTSMDR